MTVYVSYSQLSSFRQCPLKWRLGSIERLAPADRKPALSLGTAFHAMLQARYEAFAAADRAGKPRSLAEAREEAFVALERASVEARMPGDRVDLAIWMYEGYDQAYGTDDDWGILAVETTVDVPFYRGVRFTGRIDLIVRERSTGRIWIVDFKTGGGKDASGAAWQRELDLDDQFGLYHRAVSSKVPKRDRLEVFGTMYALIRSDRLKREMTLEERFGRYRMFRSEQTLDAIWSDAILTARAMGRTRTDVAAGRPVYSSPDPGQCRWKCDFVEPHLMVRATGRDVVSVARDFGFVEREPRP